MLFQSPFLVCRFQKSNFCVGIHVNVNIKRALVSKINCLLLALGIVFQFPSVCCIVVWSKIVWLAMWPMHTPLYRREMEFHWMAVPWSFIVSQTCHPRHVTQFRLAPSPTRQSTFHLCVAEMHHYSPPLWFPFMPQVCVDQTWKVQCDYKSSFHKGPIKTICVFWLTKHHISFVFQTPIVWCVYHHPQRVLFIAFKELSHQTMFPFPPHSSLKRCLPLPMLLSQIAARCQPVAANFSTFSLCSFLTQLNLCPVV